MTNWKLTSRELPEVGKVMDTMHHVVLHEGEKYQTETWTGKKCEWTGEFWTRMEGNICVRVGVPRLWKLPDPVRDAADETLEAFKEFVVAAGEFGGYVKVAVIAGGIKTDEYFKGLCERFEKFENIFDKIKEAPNDADH